jgi:hypothetical protein
VLHVGQIVLPLSMYCPLDLILNLGIDLKRYAQAFKIEAWNIVTEMNTKSRRKTRLVNILGAQDCNFMWRRNHRAVKTVNMVMWQEQNENCALLDN